MNLIAYLKYLLSPKAKGRVLCPTCDNELPYDYLEIPGICSACGQRTVPVRWGEGE